MRRVRAVKKKNIKIAVEKKDAEITGKKLW